MSEAQKGLPKRALLLAEQLKMADILKHRYKESGLDDAAFALDINTSGDRKSFKADVTVSNVKSVRIAMGIPNNRARVVKPKPDTLISRVERLEQQISKLLGERNVS